MTDPIELLAVFDLVLYDASSHSSLTLYFSTDGNLNGETLKVVEVTPLIL